MGCKPAALFMLRSEYAPALLSSFLGRRFGLSILRKSEKCALVFVFERDGLEKTLQKRDALAVLQRWGYPQEASLLVLLDCLRSQFTRCDVQTDAFPHEIGLFLGYPVEDVLGFVQHKGKNCKFSGYWKVYGNVEHAKKCFRQYDACREWAKIHFPLPAI